jgi:hypothetical protein
MAIFSLLAAIGGGALFFSLPTPEPSYQGQPLSGWIRGWEIPNNYPTDEPRAALRAMGEPAVTRLIELLQRHDSALKQKFLSRGEQSRNFL